MDSWLFPASKKVHICIFLTSITEVVTVGLTSLKKTVKIQFFRAVSYIDRYLVHIIFEYGIHFPIAHLLIESRSVFGA